jgi:DNA-binding MarR family transcriptional regulator
MMRRSDNDYDHHILKAIASGQRITQRSLSKEMGVALGLTNLLIRRLVAKGYVRVAGMGSRHVLYLMTPAGLKALGHATRQSLENTVHLYTQTREQIRMSLSAVSERCEIDAIGQKRVVFYGAGDVAEIAYVSLQGTDLTLIGVIDDRRKGKFFGIPISAPEQLSANGAGLFPNAHVVVTSVRHSEIIRARLEALGVPHSRVSAL